jgi:flagellar basal-body rod modification protein FlgD
MTTTSTTNTTDPYAAINGTKTSTSSASNNTLDQNAFLKLMIAQMKNQDPTKPQDPTQFMSQLAQFSQVTAVQDMQTSINTLADSMRSTQLLNGTSLVGHDVLSKASTDTIDTGGTVTGAIDAPAGTTAAQVVVTDAAGTEVRRFNLTNAGQGLNNFTWDGLTNTGLAAPAGQYTFSAAVAVGGTAEAVDTMLVSKVGSVTIDPSTSALTLNTTTGAVAFADVRSVL